MSDEQNWTTSVNGTTPEYFRIRNWKAVGGRLLVDRDVEASTKVVVLGQTVVDKLYGAVDPVGQTVRIKNIPFEVVGVLEKKGQSPSGQDYDDCVFIPQSTFQTKIQGGLQQVHLGDDLPRRDLHRRHRARRTAGHRPAARSPSPRATAPTTTFRSAT